MPGPPPGPNSRRRNAPTITGQILPAEGRTEKAPTVPRAYKLGTAGKAWWRWAWKLPQATKWNDGDLFTVTRRAQLEDELAALKFNDEVDLGDLLAGADKEAIRRVEWALIQLKRSASGATSLNKEMDQLDDRLGLNPKAMAALRWTISDQPAAAPAGDGEVTELAEYRARLG